jgi:hypothetical protein
MISKWPEGYSPSYSVFLSNHINIATETGGSSRPG